MMSVLLIMITIKRVSCKVWLTRFFLVSHRLHFKKLSPKCSTRSSQTNERCKEGKVHLLYTVYGFKKQIIVFVCIDMGQVQSWVVTYTSCGQLCKINITLNMRTVGRSSFIK